MDIQKLIVGLKERDTQQLCKQRLKVVTRIGPRESADLIAMRTAIDRELMRRFDVPNNGWSDGRQGEPRYFMKDGEKVAVVFRFETHGAEKGGYGIEVLDELLDEYPRHVDEARRLAELSLSER